ncbi:MAG TPA: ferritin-like domain-containing protein [Thermoplasmata archaeon]|jgi:bacterioferritin
MDKAKVISTMNEALALELTSALKYLAWSFQVFGPARKPIVEHFLEEAKESFDHATMLGEKVVALGGKPNVRADAAKPAEGMTVDDMLKLAVENEKAALDIYARLLDMVQDETHLRVLFENQIETEQEHLEEVSKMLRR